MAAASSRRRYCGASALTFALVLAACLPSAASAATTYHVSPSGSGSECTSTEPCNIVFALGSAGSGDTILVAGNEGSYGLPQNPTFEVFNVPNEVTMEGVPGQPRPVLYAAGVGHAVELGMGANLTSFDIHYSASSGEALVVLGYNSVERVLADSSDGTACLMGIEVTVTDSICTGASGLYESVGGGGSFPLTLRNDTIYAQTTGLVLNSNGPELDVTADNTIVHGGSEDILAIDQGAGHVSVSFSHSNYASVTAEGGAAVTTTGSGTNQTATPLFANALAGDFHELPGSPTVDAGANEAANGAFDLDGNQRELPAKFSCAAAEPAITDIGAFELVPAVLTCPAPPGAGSAGTKGSGGGESSLPPETKISKEKIKGDAVTFEFKGTGPGPLHFECKLDGRKYARCRSPKTYGNLSAGKHHFRVRAGSSAGTDRSPASRSFRIQH
jgi:hypothetical protein